MISEEIWEKFKDGKVVFNCKTQELWDGLMIELEKRGYNVRIAEGKYWGHDEEGYGIDNESGNELQWGNIRCYRRNYPYLKIVDVTNDDFSEPLDLTFHLNAPQPPQGLIDIIRTIATCEFIEKTHDIQLYLGELYDKREEYLTEWTSKFEVHL